MYQNPASLYRLWNGRLYRTIEILEADYHCVVGTPTSVTAKRSIRFRRERFSPWIALEVRIEHKSEVVELINDRWERQESVDGKSCEGYEWMPSSFSFELTENATQALCQ